MPLSDLAIRRAKPTDKGYRLADGGGLHLFITPAGGKLWRWRYERNGKEQLLSLGRYPDLSLAEAREARDAARRDLTEGEHPGALKKARRARATQEAADTFESIAREWHQLNIITWTERHASDVLGSLETRVFPVFGAMPVRKITSADVLAVIRAIETTAIEAGRRVRQRMSAVFVYAIATGRAETDPAAPVKGALAPLIKGRQPAVTELDDVIELLRRVDTTPAAAETKLALRLLALTAVRPGVLIATPWAEIDAIEPETPVWRVPAARMKLRAHLKNDGTRDHLVPLSRQSVEVLTCLRSLTGRRQWLLPNARRPMQHASENALGYLLNRAGYHNRHVPHGWRATFSTIMNERYPNDRAVIDLMLAHVPKDKVERAYNRAERMERRRELAQIWADLISAKLAPPEDLVGLPQRVNLTRDCVRLLIQASISSARHRFMPGAIS